MNETASQKMLDLIIDANSGVESATYVFSTQSRAEEFVKKANANRHVRSATRRLNKAIVEFRPYNHTFR